MELKLAKENLKSNIEIQKITLEDIAKKVGRKW